MNYPDLFGYLDKNNIWYDVVVDGKKIENEHDIVNLGLPLGRVAKSLVLVCGKYSGSEKGLLTIIPSNRKLDYKKVRERLKGYVNYHAPCGHSSYISDDIRPATPVEVLEYSGYPVGSVPPINHRDIHTHMLDRKLMEFKTVLTGSGFPDKLIELKIEDIIRLCNPDIYDISGAI
ncbi:MAG: YbaK/EbsC family protein [Candidatus Aenigmarchaeota archaeon]|nr:YbaK/EbsC family protein [Candidatus Aenigmarchaeota archaeon]